VLIRVWEQKVRGQGHSRQWPKKLGEYNMFVTVIANFTKNRSHNYLGQETYWLGFWIKRSKVRVTQGRHNRRWQPIRFHLQCVSKNDTDNATHSQTIPAFTPEPQGITTLWLILITPTHGGMARLSWSVWLVRYWDRFSHTRSWNPHTVTHPSTNRYRHRLTSSIDTNALTTTPNHQPD